MIGRFVTVIGIIKTNLASKNLSSEFIDTRVSNNKSLERYYQDLEFKANT